MEQFQVKGRTLVIRMPKELDHHTTGQIPHVSDRIWRILHLAGVTKVLEVEKERNWKENK